MNETLINRWMSDRGIEVEQGFVSAVREMAGTQKKIWYGL